MRYFATSSQVVTTVRVEGFFPSRRTAMFLAERLCYVFEEEDVDVVYALCEGFHSGLPTEAAMECFRAHMSQSSDASSPLPKSEKDFWGARLLLREALTETERSICEGLLSWWQGDDQGEEGSSPKGRAFVAHNLNAGRSVVIVARQSVREDVAVADFVSKLTPR